LGASTAPLEPLLQPCFVLGYFDIESLNFLPKAGCNPVVHACNPSYSKAEIRRREVRSQPGQIVRETLSQKKKPSQKRAGRVVQRVDPEFEPQYCKKKKKNFALPKLLQYFQVREM
jgi:hypothetical protein